MERDAAVAQRSPIFRCADDSETWLDGVATNLKAGDALLFVGSEFFAEPGAATTGISGC